VTKFSKEAVLGLNSEDASSSPKDDGLDEMNEAILLPLSDETVSSLPSFRQIARRTCVPTSTAYRRFVDSLHFTSRYLHWVLHKLSDSQKASRVKSSQVESSRVKSSQVDSGCRSNFATSCCPSGIKDRMAILLALDES
jgi:hypothetical protein